MTAPPPLPLLWSRNVRPPLRGLSLAREQGAVLCWHGQGGLTRFGRAGELQAERLAPSPVVAAAVADEGGTVAACGQEGQVWLLNPDLTTLWERRVSRRPVALALDPLGYY